MWYHHEAAMRAAQEWDDEESTPFQYKGGHLLKRLPLFQKGDKVQVWYEDEWWNATILRRKEDADGNYLYQVQYGADKTKQSGVDESLIQRRPELKQDPKQVALSIGLGEGWEAELSGKNRWKITAPDGATFGGKKKALDYYKLTRDSELSGDPPWRTTQSEYLQRKVLWTTEHKPSSRRTVNIEQIGTVVGWIRYVVFYR